MLLTLPDILSPDDIRTARALLRSAPWADGRDSAGPQARTAKNNQQLPHDSAAATAIRQMVLAGDVLDAPEDENVIAGVRANVEKQCAQFPVYG